MSLELKLGLREENKRLGCCDCDCDDGHVVCGDLVMCENRKGREVVGSCLVWWTVETLDTPRPQSVIMVWIRNDAAGLDSDMDSPVII